MEEKQHEKGKKLSLVIIAVCLLSLSIGLIFVTNTSSVAHASSGQGSFNEEYDAKYADIMDRYEQSLITYEEAEAEYITLSQRGVVIQTESPQGGVGIVPMSTTASKSGNVSWIPTSGATPVPLRRIKVVLYNGLPGPGLTEIASTYSDYNGNWSVTYTKSLLGLGPDFTNLSIAVYAESETFRVARDWTAITPLLEYSVFAWFDSDVNQGDRFNLIYSFENNDRHKAFRVSQGMSWAQRYAKEIGGMSTNKKLKVVYGSHVNTTSFCWNTFSGIGAGDCDNLDTLLHEYGHFVTGAMGNLPINFFDLIFNASDFMHSGTEDHFVGKGKQFALDLAWMEAWATGFALMAYDQYSGVYGTNGNMSSEATFIQGYNAQNNNINGNSGEAQERAVTSLLYDLFGARNTNLLTDTWAPLGHVAFWQRTMSSGTTTLINFANNMSSSYPQFRNQVGTRMSFFKIAPQALTLINTPNAGTAPSFSWRVNGSQNNPNNQFRFAFYNANGVQVYETGNLTYTLTADPANPTRRDLDIATAHMSQAQWEAALAAFSNGGTAQVAVKGYLNTSPVSGPYWSATQSISVNYARLTYTAVSGGLSVTGLSFMPSNGIVDIPATYNGQAVVAIGNSAFANQTQLSQITIPASVTSIGENAFANCTNLTSVTFAGGNIANIPNHTTSYTNYWYTQQSLDVRLKAGQTYILSFDYNNLMSSTARTNVFTSLGVGENDFSFDLPVQQSFSNTVSGRQVITFTPTANQLATSDKLWVRFIRTSTPQTVSIDISNINLYANSQLDSIESYGFSNCSGLTQINIPINVKNIGVSPFQGCTNLQVIFEDGRFIRDYTNGSIYVVANGYPFYISHDHWIKIKPQAYVNIHSSLMEYLPKQPKDGTYVQNLAGDSYVFAGGKAFEIYNWANLGGVKPTIVIDNIQIREWSNRVPKDGTYIRNLAGTVFVFAGGRAFGIHNWANVGGSQPSTIIENEHINVWAHKTPEDGTYVRNLAGTVFVFAGGKAFGIYNWANVGGAQPSTVIDNIELIPWTQKSPKDGTIVKTLSGKYFRYENNVPIQITFEQVGNSNVTLVDELSIK